MATSQDGVMNGLQRQYCHFPTATHERGTRTTIDRVRAIDYVAFAKIWGGDKTKFEGSLNNAWAVLLRHYVQNEFVCFGALLRSNVLRNESAEPESSTSAELLVSHYQVRKTNRLEDIRILGTQSCAVKDLVKRQINTAIAVISRVDEALPGDYISERLLFDRYPLDLILTVNELTFETFLHHRQPYVSTKYAASIARTLNVILQAHVNQCSLLVNQIDVFGDSSKQLLKSWNPSNPFSVETKACLHHLVEAQARSIPTDQAVCAWDGSLTYSQLDQLSNAVSEDLVMLGIGVGSLVPFAMEKTKWSVIVTLAILKTGAAFVPLNPNDPKARLKDLLKAVSARVVIITESLIGKFEKLVEHVISVPADPSKSKLIHLKGKYVLEQNGYRRSSQPSDSVFVLFTSGSTGTPKGMIHEHAAICTHALVHGQAMAYHKARVLQFAAHTFDIAIIDIFTTLLFGGCVCIPSDEARQSDIVGAINEMEVDFTILTPSIAGLIEPTDVPTLKTLAVGGEALPQDRIQRWADTVNLIQVYGPAEVGICHTNTMSMKTRPETIGYPLSNSSCWLVDPEDSDRLVPIGAVGELVVGGPSLAQGYIHNEARTRDSFIHKPSWAEDLKLTLSRFYKTGDLLRYNLASFDGSFDFIGRKDHQIKLRGQRIEPGEVEYHLGQLPGVEISMVALPESGCHAGKLVAVVQMRNKDPFKTYDGSIRLSCSPDLSIGVVRESLSRSLPVYMVPTVCLTVDSMPLVPSLKIDRRSVHEWLKSSEILQNKRAPAMTSPLSPRELTASALSHFIVDMARNRTQATVKGLGGSDIQLHQYGIDSIQIISLAMFLRKQFSRVIPLSALLSPTLTIRELAAFVDSSAVSLENGSVLPSSSLTPGSVDVLCEVKSLQKDLKGTSSVRKNQLNGQVQSPHRNVLLTGATGYLGIAILHRLLLIPNTNIFALVRGEDEEIGRQRIAVSALSQGWWDPAYASRLSIWPGDLSKPDLGLQPQHLALLQGSHINAIIHNGAQVHYSTSYTVLKPSNVLSTLFLLGLTAQSSSVKTFVFLSGGEKPHLDNPLTDNAYVSRLNERANGYTLSKVASESLVRGCAEDPAFSAKRLRVVKPGYIIGSATNGIANQSDFLWRLVAGCVETGAYNADEAGRWLFVSDVESVAERVVEGTTGGDDSQEGEMSACVHVERVLDGLTFRDLWEMLELEFGYQLMGLEWEKWMAKLKARVLEVGEDHKLFPLLHTLEYESNAIGGEIEPRGASESVKAVVRSNVRYLIDVGFLPAVCSVR